MNFVYIAKRCHFGRGHRPTTRHPQDDHRDSQWRHQKRRPDYREEQERRKRRTLPVEYTMEIIHIFIFGALTSASDIGRYVLCIPGSTAESLYCLVLQTAVCSGEPYLASYLQVEDILNDFCS